MPEPRSDYAAGVVAGKLIGLAQTYWTGLQGTGSRNSSASTHAFDPASATWENFQTRLFLWSSGIRGSGAESSSSWCQREQQSAENLRSGIFVKGKSLKEFGDFPLIMCIPGCQHRRIVLSWRHHPVRACIPPALAAPRRLPPEL